MRIAWVGPVSPCQAGQARHAELLLQHLADKANIDLFVDDYVPTSPFIRDRFRHFSYTELPSRHLAGEYDVVVYQVGNNHYHDHVLDLLPRIPGVVDLHEVKLDGLLWRKNRVIRDLGSLIRCAKGVITHSQYQHDSVARLCRTPLTHIALPTSTSAQIEETEMHALRSELGLPEKALVIGSFGFAHPHKRLEVAMQAFTRLVGSVGTALYLHVGAVPDALSDYWNRLLNVAYRSITADRVRVTGWVSDEEMARYMLCTDICINLRYPSVGEVSATALQCMGAGKPVLLTPVDSFREFPDEVCIKIPTGRREVDTVAESLRRLSMDPIGRKELGARAYAYVEDRHNPEKVAHQYLRFIESIAPGRASDIRLTDRPVVLRSAHSKLVASPGEPVVVPLILSGIERTAETRHRTAQGADLYLRGRLYASAGDVSPPWVRELLPEEIRTGRSQEWNVVFPAPAASGQYLLDLFVEGDLMGLPGFRTDPVIRLPLTVWPDSRQPGILCASISPDAGRLVSQCGAEVELRVQMRNCGDTVWLSSTAPQRGDVSLGGHLYGSHGRLLIWDFLRVPLPHNVKPEEQVTISSVFAAPGHPGHFRLGLAMVDEHITWFERTGSHSVSVILEVAP